MIFQLIVPQYNENEEVLRNLLDSVALQQNVNFNDIGVVIINDGNPNSYLSTKFLRSYPFKIDYIKSKHLGVSAARNTGLDHATADYVMFCDADDMFFNACGLYIVFNQIAKGGFETFVSCFLEETRNPESKEIVYVQHDADSTFVHGKIHNRKFLIDNKIRWNEKLTIHEDSYFNCLCQKIASPEKAIYCPSAFYLWKWRDNSVCRHDPKYILKTFNNMLDSNTELVNEFIKRNRASDAQFHSVAMIYESYFTMNKPEWINQENKEYREATEKRFTEYYKKFKFLFDAIDEKIKAQIIMTIKNRMFQEGLLLESITFDDWIKHILETY